MSKRKRLILQTAPRMKGLSSAAALLGVSRTHLREVVLGNRQSRSLMERLRAHNIKIKI